MRGVVAEAPEGAADAVGAVGGGGGHSFLLLSAEATFSAGAPVHSLELENPSLSDGFVLSPRRAFPPCQIPARSAGRASPPRPVRERLASAQPRRPIA